MWREFKAFAFSGSVIELAVGVMIGAAFNTVIQAVVADVLTPLVGLVGGSPDLAGVVITVGDTRLAVGDLANAFIYFTLIAVVLFAVVKAAGRVRRQVLRPPAPVTRACPWCLEPVAIAALRCRHCTAELEAVPAR
jgi:large conductance mechanosensitive channel